MLCTISHWFSSPWWQWCSRECYLSERRRCYDPNRRCSDTSGTPQTTWGTIAHCRAEPRRRCLRIRIGMHHQPAQSHKSVRDRLVSSKSVDICIYRGIRATRVGGESSCWAVGCPGQPSDGPDAALPFYRRPSGGAAQKKKKKFPNMRAGVHVRARPRVGRNWAPVEIHRLRNFWKHCLQGSLVRKETQQRGAKSSRNQTVFCSVDVDFNTPDALWERQIDSICLGLKGLKIVELLVCIFFRTNAQVDWINSRVFAGQIRP